jgi:hypothetical protein
MTDINDSEFEEPPEREPAWLRLDRATAYRKKLLAAGYLPIPVNGKAPPIQGWSDIQATDALIDRWAEQYASASNTGIITAYTPAIDIDVVDPAVADELHRLVEQMIGTSVVRTGLAPKRALLFRTYPKGRDSWLGPTDCCRRYPPRHATALHVAWWRAGAGAKA